MTLGNFDVLVQEIDRLYGKRMRIWITEYGYQTNPPDKIFGVTWRKQATYLTQAVARKDTFAVIGMVLVVGVIVTFVGLLVNLVQRAADPRVRLLETRRASA